MTGTHREPDSATVVSTPADVGAAAGPGADTWHDRIQSEPLWYSVLRLGLPAALALFAHAAINLVDLLLVGRFGPDAVAGVHAATTINFLPMLLGNGITVATLSMLSRRLGAGDLAGARALARRSQLWMLALGLGIGGLGGLLVEPSIAIQGDIGTAASGYGIDYLLVSQLGAFTMFALMQVTTVMRAAGEIVMPVALLVLANVLNLLLDVVLMFGWDAAGIPAYGPVGAAWASVLGRFVAVLPGLWWLRRPKHPLRLERDGDRIGDEFGSALRLAVPQTLQMLVRALLVVAVNRVAHDSSGDAALAALGVTMRLDTTVLFSTLGFATAGTTVVGHLIGAGRHAEAQRAARMTVIQAGLFAVFAILLLVLFADAWIQIFIAAPGVAVLAEGRLYLQLAAWQHLPAACCIAMAGAVNGAGRMVAPMVLDLVGFGGLLIPVLLLAGWAQAPLAVCWAWLVVGQALLLLAYGLYLRRTNWTEPPRALPA